MNQDTPHNPSLSAILEKMADTLTYKGRRPKSLHDRALNGNTPLHVAVLSNDLVTGKILLDAGANPNAPGENSESPLHTAIRQKNYDFVQLLLSYAASKEFTNKDGLNSADLAQQLSDSKLDLIFSSSPGKQLTPEVAAVLEEMEKAELSDLPEKLTSVNARGILGDTPLHIAVAWGDTKVGKILLDAGANPNLPGEYDCTPLHQAISQKKYDFVELLLSHGASKELRNEDGFTSVDYAKQSKDPRLIELLCG